MAVQFNMTYSFLAENETIPRGFHPEFLNLFR